MTAIREARHHPPNSPLTEIYQTQLIAYRQLCEQMKASTHTKTHAQELDLGGDPMIREV